MVVVSRWYGGIHLGPDRFKLINQARLARHSLFLSYLRLSLCVAQAARDALTDAGFLQEAEEKKGKGGSAGKGASTKKR
jgi:hypothetical protein